MKNRTLADPRVVEFRGTPLQFSVHEPGRHMKRDLSLIFPENDLSDIRIIPLFYKASRSMVASDTETNQIRDRLLVSVRLSLLDLKSASPIRFTNCQRLSK